MGHTEGRRPMPTPVVRLLGIIALLLLFAAPARGAPPLLPAPAAFEARAGSFAVAQEAVIAVPAGDAAAGFDARWLAGAALKDRGLKLLVRTGSPGSPAIRLERGHDLEALGGEGYRLAVSPAGVLVEAATDAGLFYGAVSLLQLLTPEDGSSGAVRLQGVLIEDRPRFAWRGLMLDSARHLQSAAFIEALIDQMARYKLNVFHWHLTDDQGWRLEIKRYPLLTARGAYRVEAGLAHQEDLDPATGRPRLYGGFYTQEEVREVVAFAKARNVTIVPEIDLPGHATAAIVAYPELGVRHADSTTMGDWGVFSNLYAVDDHAFRFLENVLAEVMDLFPGPYVHLGGDEAIKPYWRASPAVQAKIKALGLKDEAALQAWFMARVARFVAARGRKAVGWDEILEGGAPEGATIMSWRGLSGGLEALKTGHDAVLTPGFPFYLDNRQSDAADEPPGRGLVIPLASVYAFDPPTVDAPGAGRLLGLQANLWTEHVRLEDQVEHMAFPRAAALAERAWSPQARKDYEGFLTRLPAAMRRDVQSGLQPAQSAFEVRAGVSPAGDHGQVRLALAAEAGPETIRYTTDGSAPTADGARYLAPFALPLPARLRARTFSRAGLALGAETDETIDAASLRRRDSHALALCTRTLALNLEDDAPVGSRTRPVILTDILNPCWMWPQADLAGVKGFAVEVAALPFNFALGEAPPPASAAGGEARLEIRLGGCGGPALAVLPLRRGPGPPGLTRLTAGIDPAVAPADGAPHDLCFQVVRPTLNPLWVVNAVELEGRNDP